MPRGVRRRKHLCRPDRQEVATMQDPRTAVSELDVRAQLPRDDGEGFPGYGVMGLPFDSGHYLALRVFHVTSIGPGFRAVWHRDPAGRWTFYATEPPEGSCARYFGAALDEARQVPIEVTWTGSHAFAVTIPGLLDWTVRLGRTPATRLLTGIGSLLPEAAWRSDAVLALMGSAAGLLLRAGHVGLCGEAPNGQHYRAAPRRLWNVVHSSARLAGADLGRPGRLRQQDRLGDFWLPQRGLFAVGTASFDVLDPVAHRTVTAGRDRRSPFRLSPMG
jgi:hypothetical protein